MCGLIVEEQRSPLWAGRTAVDGTETEMTGVCMEVVGGNPS